MGREKTHTLRYSSPHSLLDEEVERRGTILIAEVQHLVQQFLMPVGVLVVGGGQQKLDKEREARQSQTCRDSAMSGCLKGTTHASATQEPPQSNALKACWK